MTTSRPARWCSSIRRDRLVVDQRVDDVVQGLGDDLARPSATSQPAHELRHELPHLLHLVVVGAADEVDELGVRRAQHRAPGDQAAGLERLAEGERARLGDDRLVEVEEGRGRAADRLGACRHGRRGAAGRVRRRPGSRPQRRSPRGVLHRPRAVAAARASGGGQPRPHDRAAARHRRRPTLLDELLRLAAAAGRRRPTSPTTRAAALRGWAAAPLVLVGADLADALARAAPAAARRRARRARAGRCPTSCSAARWRSGAESVAELPRVGGLAGRAAHRRRRRRAAARPARSGWSAGPAAPARRRSPARSASWPRRGRARRRSSTPTRSGPGVDRVLGLERRGDGVRWDALCQHHRPAQRALAARGAAAPRTGSAVLTWDAGPAGAPAGVRGARGALGRAARPRHWWSSTCRGAVDAVVEEVVARCDQVLRRGRRRRSPGVAAAGRVRAPAAPAPGAAAAWSSAAAAASSRRARSPASSGCRWSPRMADQRGLAEAIDLGLGPVRSPARRRSARAARGRARPAAAPAGAAAARAPSALPAERRSTAVRERLAREPARR